MTTFRIILAAAALAQGITLASSAVASAKPVAAPRDYVAVACEYPHGWNYTDAYRDINGTPAGADHACLVPANRAANH